VTGAGKSYFIMEVTGYSEVKVNRDINSCKVVWYCRSQTQILMGKRYQQSPTLLVREFRGKNHTGDTPSFNDIGRSDTDILQESADWASATYKKEQLLFGIIYLHPSPIPAWKVLL